MFTPDWAIFWGSLPVAVGLLVILLERQGKEFTKSYERIHSQKWWDAMLANRKAELEAASKKRPAPGESTADYSDVFAGTDIGPSAILADHIGTGKVVFAILICPMALRIVRAGTSMSGNVYEDVASALLLGLLLGFVSYSAMASWNARTFLEPSTALPRSDRKRLASNATNAVVVACIIYFTGGYFISGNWYYEKAVQQCFNKVTSKRWVSRPVYLKIKERCEIEIQAQAEVQAEDARQRSLDR